jgi:hypothetical protein
VIPRVKIRLVAWCPTCGVLGVGEQEPVHTRGCDDPRWELTDRLRVVRWRRERKRDGWYAEDVDYLLELVDLLRALE